MPTNAMLTAVLMMLVAGIAAELAPSVRAGRMQAAVPPTPVALSVAAAPNAEPSAAYIEQILARPLFTEGRRPPTAAASPAAQAQVDKPPRLSGILVTGNDRRAIFESSGKPIVAVVGTRLGAYRVLAITPQQVTLQGPGGMLAMSLSYGASDAATPASAAPGILDSLNSGSRPPVGLPKTPTFQDMMSTLPKTMPPMLNGMPQNDTRPVR